MDKNKYQGIGFGFIFLIIWLLLLTGYTIYDKINIGEKIEKVIILPPPVESLEIIENTEYDIL